jgi:hypothetical protein
MNSLIEDVIVDSINKNFNKWVKKEKKTNDVKSLETKPQPINIKTNNELKLIPGLGNINKNAV